MQKTKVVRLLELMTKSELQGIKHFLNNPVFNKNQEVIKLYDFIYSFQSDYENKRFTAELAYKAIKPKGKFDKQALNRILNQLFETVKRFINCLQIENQQYSEEFALLDFYFERISSSTKDNRFENQHKRTLQLINKNYKGVQQLEKKLDLSYSYALYLSKFFPLKERNSELLKDMNRHLYASILNLYCDILNNCLIGNLDQLPPQLNSFIASVPDTVANYPIIELWYKMASTFLLIHQTVNQETNGKSINKIARNHFDLLNTIFRQRSQLLSQEEQYNFFVFLNTVLNYTDVSEDEFYLEHFQKHQFALEKGYLFIDQTIRGQDAKNIITAAIKSQHSDWLEEFFKSYEKKIEKRFRKDLYFYGMAKIAFERGEIKKADQLISQIEVSKYIFFQISEKIMKIQIYYELEEDGLYSAISNLEVFLSKKQKQLDKNDLLSNRNFCGIVKRLINTLNGEKETINKIVEEIQQIPTNGLPERSWLLTKLKDK